MKHKSWLAAGLLLLLLAGCGTPEPGASSPSPGIPSITADTRPASGEETAVLPEPGAHTQPGRQESGEVPAAQTEAHQTAAEPVQTEPAWTKVPEPLVTEPPVTEPPAPAASDPKPAVLSMGLYNGPFPEDGSGEAVESVAVLLVENRSETQLQYAELHYIIDGREALFRVSELPAGERCMAVELNRLVAMPVSEWKAAPEADLAVWLPAEIPDSLALEALGDGKLRVTNRGSKRSRFELIYKQRGEDGILLGGIAYHVGIPALDPGETQLVDAPHFNEQSVVVRITAKEP